MGSEQLRLLPSETNVERTLRTGNIDAFGAMFYSMQDLVTIFDDVVTRPEHYYREAVVMSPSAAPFLGQAMFHNAVEAVYQDTAQEIIQMQTPLFESVLHHMRRKDPPEGTFEANIDDVLREGMRSEEAALDVLKSAIKSPRFIFNVLRSDNGFNAKIFCLIMDAPEKTLHLSSILSCVEEPEKVSQALGLLRHAEGIKVISSMDWSDEDDTDPRYTQSDYFRYEEDSEVMALARLHAQRYNRASLSHEE